MALHHPTLARPQSKEILVSIDCVVTLSILKEIGAGVITPYNYMLIEVFGTIGDI